MLFLTHEKDSFFNNKAQAAPSSTVYFDPASIAVDGNSTFSLEIKVDPGTNQVYAVAPRVAFDPTKVQVVSIVENSSVFKQVIAKGSFNNSTGAAAIDLLTAFPPDQPVITTPTTVATLTFQAIADGSSSISFTSDTIVGAKGESGNVVSAMNPAAVTVNSKTYTLSDWTNIALHWLQNLSGESNGDYNGDSIVNTRDIGIVMHDWQ